MKRIGVASIVLIVVAVLLGSFARDSLYWKRRALAAIYSAATLPASYYEPSELIEGTPEGGSIPRVSPEQERLDPAALQAAVEYADGQRTTALIVGRHGHIVFEHYWDDATFDTVIDAGAFSATLTALTVGMAMGDRKIALPAEPVANYIESFRNADRAAITLEDLLHMTSGLGSAQGGVDPWTASTREHFAHDIRNECLELTPRVPHDSIWHPQACDPQLLAHIVERATGQQYSKFVSDRIWKPIGAADAHLMLDREGGTAHASCCLRARQGDWMRVAELLVTGGKFGGEQILPPGWVRAMLAPSKANSRFGYQVWRGEPFVAGEGASEPYAAADTFLLKGNGKTRLWLVPSMGLSILRVGTNDQIDTDWDDSRIPNMIIRGASDYVPNAGSQGVSDLVPNH
jgi:CubicO group peptidase (beta-lactamase class C family)